MTKKQIIVYFVLIPIVVIIGLIGIIHSCIYGKDAQSITFEILYSIAFIAFFIFAILVVHFTKNKSNNK